MSKPKHTFTDLQTGEEIESTALARWVAGLGAGWVAGLGLGFFGLVVWLICDLPKTPLTGLAAALVEMLVGVLGSVLVIGSLIGLFIGLVCDLLVRLGVDLDYSRADEFYQRVHDHIARHQHFHRQRLLQRKLAEEEWAGVPDGALSRAQPSGEPEPTAAALSRSEAPEEAAPRLTAGVDAATGEEELVATR
jgi:hypothetical protein